MKLVVAEKPIVAMSIASVIGASQKKNGYVEGNGYMVSWCVGHLVDLSLPESYNEAWGAWSIDQLPIIPEKYKHSVKAETSAQYKILKELLNSDSVDEVVCATDAGREGELIFRRVYYKAGCTKPMKRLWISSMEDSAIEEGMHNLRDSREFDNLYNSAMCRAKADWVIGINMTRLMTKVYDTSVLNVGRVISPTLAMICEREKQITLFVKQKFYRVHLKTAELDALSERIDDEEQAKSILQSCQGQSAVVKEIIKENKTEKPPLLYDLTSLQGDANSMFGFTAKHTLELTQSLYEAKLVTYPRTDAKYLTNDMENTAKDVIDTIYSVVLGFPAYTRQEADTKIILDSSKVSDHHAIIPTVQIRDSEKLKSLSQEQLKLLALISCRLLCATGKKHIYSSTKAVISCAGTDFSVSGRTVLDNGWKDYENTFKMFYKSDKDEEKEKEDVTLPDLTQNQEILNASFNISEHFTTPPKRFNDKTLLRTMESAGNSEMSDEVERKGIGTPATRAEVIETLIRQKFVERDKKNLVPTQKGINLIEVLPEMITSVKLTVEWENRLLLISKGQDTEEAFMTDIEKFCCQMVAENKVPKEGKENLFPRAFEKEVAGKCPSCGADVYSGKHGLYCSNKCGMALGTVYAFGKELTQPQIKNLINGNKVLLKDLVSKAKGTTYDAYAVPDGVEDYEYVNKSGENVKTRRFKFKMEFPTRKK